MKHLKKILKNHRLTVAVVAILCAALIFSAGSAFSANAAATKAGADGNYYYSDYATKTAAMAGADALNEEICSEGITLLKNEDGALPLGDGAKISLFGKSSSNILIGGSGAGGGTGSGPAVTIQQSLAAAGFQLNPTLVNFYNNSADSGTGRGTPPSNPNISSGYNTGETPVASYTSTVEESYGDYSDAALVVFSRIGGEGFDLPRTMTWNGSSYGTWGTQYVVPGARSGTDHYLQLDANEGALLKYLGGKFNKVIVLLNTGSQFETGFLDDEGHYGYHKNIKAAMWIGYPGTTGLWPLGKVLKGEINPSGRTTDTWARDFKADPTWQNFGNNRVASGNLYTGTFTEPFIYYKEGIYAGYRYYETRGYTEGLTTPWAGALECGTTTANWDSWYDAHVVYPFGYGLSYSDFQWTVESNGTTPAGQLSNGGSITANVTVKNTGNMPGKDVVQLYYTAPYKGAGKIEKAHVVLGAFEKTKLLATGESQTLTLTLKVRDMASYDWSDANGNGFKGYELDEGDYTVRVMRNAHNQVASTTYTVPAGGYKYEMDIDGKADGNDNQFDDVSEETGTTLSRADWVGTFPETVERHAAKAWIASKATEWKTNNYVTDAPGQPYYTDVMPTTGDNTASNGVVLADLVGLDYDDPLWDDFLDQFSVSTMQSFAGGATYFSGRDVPALGVTRVINADGPSGFYYGTSGNHAYYACTSVLAATWNKTLARRQGIMFANEGLHGNGTDYSKYPGLYAPGVNIHRSQFGGRNYEYYSEDGYLTGTMASHLVAGAKSKGLFCYVKHFAVNDQDTSRNNLNTWATEQSMREIYFKGFEICVKEGKTTAIMTANNRVGAVWAGGNYELVTNVLRKEWGFQGTVVSDYAGGAGGYMNANHAIRAGNDMMLGAGNPTWEITGATAVAALRRVVHNVCYTHANSMAMNAGATAVKSGSLESFAGSTLAVGVTGESYSASVATAVINKVLYPDAADDEVEYELKEGSVLPDGLTLSPDGTVSGTPEKKVNNYRFTVTATFDGHSQEAIFTIHIIDSSGAIVYSGEQPQIVLAINEPCDASVALASINKPNATPEEIENFPPITYQLKNGSLLPLGITLSSDGSLSGTPTVECKDYEFTVTARAAGFDSQDMTFKLSVFHSLTFDVKTLAEGRVGVPYSDKVALAVSDKEVTYSIESGSSLPNGLFLTKSGYITGTPTNAVTEYAFTVVAEADFCAPVSVEYTVSVGLKFKEGDTQLTSGQAGEAYIAYVDTASGADGITYAVKTGNGALPAGLALSDSGVISGTPTQSGTFTFTITASADEAIIDEVTLTLFIQLSQADLDGTPGQPGGCESAVLGSGIAGGTLILFILGAAGFVSFARKKKRDDTTKTQGEK